MNQEIFQEFQRQCYRGHSWYTAVQDFTVEVSFHADVDRGRYKRVSVKFAFMRRVVPDEFQKMCEQHCRNSHSWFVFVCTSKANGLLLIDIPKRCNVILVGLDFLIVNTRSERLRDSWIQGKATTYHPAVRTKKTPYQIFKRICCYIPMLCPYVGDLCKSYDNIHRTTRAFFMMGNSRGRWAKEADLSLTQADIHWLYQSDSVQELDDEAENMCPPNQTLSIIEINNPDASSETVLCQDLAHRESRRTPKSTSSVIEANITPVERPTARIRWSRTCSLFGWVNSIWPARAPERKSYNNTQGRSLSTRSHYFMSYDQEEMDNKRLSIAEFIYVADTS